MAKADSILPSIDYETLQEAFAVAEASSRETNPTIRALLEEQALLLWALAHQGRRDAMYTRGRR